VGREPKLDMAMAAGMLGLAQPDGAAGAFALALVMHTLKRWEPPTGRALERARKAAARFKISDDLAIFLPPEPGRFAGRERRDAYRGLLISLKQLDALEGAARAKAIVEVKLLLGAG
jgi:hypothetical protein